MQATKTGLWVSRSDRWRRKWNGQYATFAFFLVFGKRPLSVPNGHASPIKSRADSAEAASEQGDVPVGPDRHVDIAEEGPL